MSDRTFTVLVKEDEHAIPSEQQFDALIAARQNNEYCETLLPVEAIDAASRELRKVCNIKRGVSEKMLEGVAAGQAICHYVSRRAGWFTDLETGELKDRNVPEMIALCHSELSEALEALRKNLMDDHLPHRKGVEAELADVLIRVFDLAGYLKLDLAGAMADKLVYNLNRADHKIENRKGDHGKQF